MSPTYIKKKLTLNLRFCAPFLPHVVPKCRKSVNMNTQCLVPMVNPFNKRKCRVLYGKEAINYRPLTSLEPSVMEAQGYYHGYPCPLGHTIRDKKQHWCYRCAWRIRSNVCGIDVNYLHTEYNSIAQRLWSDIEITDQSQCWEVEDPKKRIQMPSYRSGLTDRRTDNVTIHKAIYNLCWGDVGTLTVTRSCNNLKCVNPLHLVSSWNNKTPMRTMMYFDLDFNYQKLMAMQACINKGESVDPLVMTYKKNVITDPRKVEISQSYNEE